jgi:hypothetical protein
MIQKENQLLANKEKELKIIHAKRVLLVRLLQRKNRLERVNKQIDQLKLTPHEEAMIAPFWDKK